MEVNIKDLEFIQLSVNTALMPFHCVDDDLNNFLVEDAKNYLNDMMAVTYLFVDNGRQQIAAYFSLLNDKVSLYIEPILLESGEDSPTYREVMRTGVAV